MSESDWLKKDYYKDLGVSQDATDDEIDKAYRRMARKYHPDLNHSPGAADKFAAANEAYGVLHNKAQRKRYDAIHRLAAGGARFTGSGGAGGYNADDFSNLFGSMFGGGQSEGSPFSSIFSQFGSRGGNSNGYTTYFTNMGGTPRGYSSQNAYQYGGGTGAAGTAGPQRGADIRSSVTLTFAQAVSGTSVRLRVGSQSFIARVPAGIHDGQSIRIPGKGRAGTNGGAAGDLYLKVTVTPDPLFSMEGRNLVRPLPLTVSEAVLGGTVEVSDFEGTRLRVCVPAGTSSGTKLRVRGRGIQSPSGNGDLLLRVEIRVPKRTSLLAKKAIRDFEARTPSLKDSLAKERIQGKDGD